MSRETNSLLLRYGLNIFWSHSLSTPRLSLSIFQFNSFIFLILRNYFLKAFRIQYFLTYINLYVFYFKEDRFSFLYKYLKLKKIILNSLFYRKRYAFLLKKKGANKIRVAKGLLKILMLINKIFLLRFFHLLLKKPVFVFYLDAGYYPILRLKQNRINKVAFKKVKKKSLLYKYKIKLINSLLKYKLLGLWFQFLTASYLKKEFLFNLKGILNIPFFFNRIPFFFKYFQNSTIKSKIYLIFLSFFFFKAFILTLYIRTLIQKTKNKKHIQTLIVFFNLLKILFDKQVIPIYGFKFKIAGRLGGKLRKATFGYQLGATSLQTFNIITNYHCDFVFTQFGSFSLKLWFFDSNNVQKKKL